MSFKLHEEYKGVITKKDLQKVFWRSIPMEHAWNYERMMHSGFCFAMLPILKKLYPKREDYIEAMQRHMELYNVTPYISTLPLGIATAEGFHGLPLFPDGLRIALHILVAHGNQQPCPHCVGPPLRPGGVKAVFLHDLRLSLQKPGEYRRIVPHIAVGGGGGVFQIAVQGLVRHRETVHIGEIFHQEQFILQIGPLKGNGVVPEDGGVKEETPDEAVEHRRLKPVPRQRPEDLFPDAGLFIDSCRQQQFCPLFPVRRHVVVGTAGAVCPGLFPQIPQGLQRRRLKGVIGVQKGNVRPRGLLQSQIPGGGHAAVGLVEHADTRVLSGVAVAQSRRAVPAAIVNQQQFPVGKGLGQNALYALGQQRFRLIDRYDHRNSGHKPPPFLHTG